MTPDDDLPEDLDTIPLHGISLPTPEAVDETPRPVSHANDEDDGPVTLTLRPYDDGVPGRDFQPRLLRFGEAA